METDYANLKLLAEIAFAGFLSGTIIVTTLIAWILNVRT
jgi:hypothetical protein